MTATGTTVQSITIRFEDEQQTLYVSKSAKVYEVVVEAAKLFHLEPLEGLGFLYQGLNVPEEITVEVCGVVVLELSFDLQFQRLIMSYILVLKPLS